MGRREVGLGTVSYILLYSAFLTVEYVHRRGKGNTIRICESVGPIIEPGTIGPPTISYQ